MNGTEGHDIPLEEQAENDDIFVTNNLQSSSGAGAENIVMLYQRNADQSQLFRTPAAGSSDCHSTPFAVASGCRGRLDFSGISEMGLLTPDNVPTELDVYSASVITTMKDLVGGASLQLVSMHMTLEIASILY
ncbi:uncharacterized protein LOC127749615 [Frankliniella occidentalis]|uniref:Uncharacterized protein LOC127749615 n=1 Tax=Frankliniella occidentalis TaxID=133901 RepID=A0A9C6U7H8_FRAOC|nr:uncharacterized protein LOC127749615 [Frankliniella occidentalis]